MKNLTGRTISEIVAEDYRTASVFSNYKIDFCCNGYKLLEDVCKIKSINQDTILKELNDVKINSNNNAQDYKSWPLDLLADYIEKKHHRYVEAKLPEIKTYLDKICQVHGNNHKELFEIQKLYNESCGELTVHIKKEERILFPYIREIIVSKEKSKKLDSPQFGSIINPIRMLMVEHNNEGEKFRKIEVLSDNYTIPEDGCNTYKVTLLLLKEFQEDLHMHIHLENNILFPGALELEKELIVNNQ